MAAFRALQRGRAASGEHKALVVGSAGWLARNGRLVPGAGLRALALAVAMELDPEVGLGAVRAILFAYRHDGDALLADG